MLIWTFVHLRNLINVRQIELPTIWLYSERGEDRFVVFQHLWYRKTCQIICRVSRKWKESKFLNQDVDVVSFANKGIVIGCFVGRNYNQILMETRKLTRTTSGSRKMDSDLVLTKSFSRRILRFTTLPIDLIHSVRVSSSTSFSLAHCLAYASHASMIISKFWCHENETGSLNFGPLRKRFLSLSFCTILRSPVTTWPHGAYKNSEPGQVQNATETGGFSESVKRLTSCRCLDIKRTLWNAYGVGSQTVSPTSSSVRLHIYVPSHI